MFPCPAATRSTRLRPCGCGNSGCCVFFSAAAAAGMAPSGFVFDIRKSIHLELNTVPCSLPYTILPRCCSYVSVAVVFTCFSSLLTAGFRSTAAGHRFQRNMCALQKFVRRYPKTGHVKYIYEHFLVQGDISTNIRKWEWTSPINVHLSPRG